MALRKHPDKIKKVTLFLDEEVWLWFKETYTKVGASEPVRMLMKNHMQVVKKKVKESRDMAPELELKAEDC